MIQANLLSFCLLLRSATYTTRVLMTHTHNYKQDRRRTEARGRPAPLGELPVS